MLLSPRAGKCQLITSQSEYLIPVSPLHTSFTGSRPAQTVRSRLLGCKQTRPSSQSESRNFCVSQSEAELSRGIFLMLQSSYSTLLLVSDVFPRCFTARWCDPLCDVSTSHKDNLNKNWIIRTIDLNIRRLHTGSISIRDRIDLLISDLQHAETKGQSGGNHWPLTHNIIHPLV